MRGAARRLPRAPRPFASPLVARLSQGVEQAEKSDEEKARLKAEREERKEAKRLAAEEKKAAKAAKAAAALLEEEAANAPLAPIAFFRFGAPRFGRPNSFSVRAGLTKMDGMCVYLAVLPHRMGAKDN